MSRSVTLVVRIDSYWRAGTGRGAAGRLDALCIRDRDGLPCLPGRAVKGLLRDAVDRAEQWGWFAHRPRPALTTRLFGEEGFRRTEDGSPDMTRPYPAAASGCLRVSNAVLPPGDRAWLKKEPQLIAHLFGTMNSTAIRHDTGAALDRSLRAEEVAMPMTLEAEIAELGGGAPPDWPEVLALAIPLVRAVGSGKSRGLGRCHVSLRGDGR
jgi:hypothetical protein